MLGLYMLIYSFTIHCWGFLGEDIFPYSFEIASYLEMNRICMMHTDLIDIITEIVIVPWRIGLFKPNLLLTYQCLWNRKISKCRSARLYALYGIIDSAEMRLKAFLCFTTKVPLVNALIDII